MIGKFFNFRVLTCLAICSFLVSSALAMPPRPGKELPEIVKRAKALGLIDYIENPIRDANKKHYVNQLDSEIVPLVTGTKRMPCVLLYFTDQDTAYSQSTFQVQLFDTTGSWSTGSCYDYYTEISYGQFSLIGDCYGWYNTGHEKNYYAYDSYGFDGEYPSNTAGLAMAAIDSTDPTVNYAQFDNDGDGYVDALWVVHSGIGAEENSSDSTCIWSHSTRLSAWITEYITDDIDPNNPGNYIKIDRYIVMPEQSRYSAHDSLVSIGVFCHEFGHSLGLPDLYDTDYSSEGIGAWGLMSAGSWGGDANSPWYPVHMCAWAKIQLGWITPTTVSVDSSYSLPAIEHSPKCYLLATNGSPASEYFLLGNRQNMGFDTNIYNSGLLIYHIDDTVSTRNDNEWYPGHTEFGNYLVALEQADGDWDLEKANNWGDAGDPYPGSSNNREFSQSTNPGSQRYDFSPTFIKVENISDSQDTMSCTISVNGPDRDVATVSIDYPPDTVIHYNIYKPRATVRNCGERLVLFQVYCRIDSLSKTIYADTTRLVLGAGYKRSVVFSEWKVPPLGDREYFNYKVTVTVHLDNDEYPNDDTKRKTIRSVAGANCADHDVGNVKFTVTCWGSYGFMSSEQNQGSGFRYPVDGANLLYYGALMAGNSPSYVVDREKDQDWNVTEDPNGHLTLGQKIYSDQDGWAMFDDSNHPTPKGLIVTQHSWAWADSPYDDFVITRYTVKNNGDTTINELYISQYMDFDIPDAYNNWGAVDDSRNLAYMWYDDSNPYVGIKLIEGDLSNVAIVHNPTYVWPDEGLADTTAFKFMAGEITLDSTTASDDYSMMVSSGPFDIDIGDSTVVAFTLLGGDDLADLQANADAAQSKYGQVGIEELASSPVPIYFELFQAAPNPMGDKTTIGYQISQESKVTLNLYNISGQLVKTLVNAVQVPGYKSVVWNGKDNKGYKVASGIYFYKLNVGKYTATKKMVIIK
jgi:M6 family metalloprotease-like protein